MTNSFTWKEATKIRKPFTFHNQRYCYGSGFIGNKDEVNGGDQGIMLDMLAKKQKH